MKTSPLPAILALFTCLAAQGQVTDVAGRRELFADGWLVERLSGAAELRLQHPVPRDIALNHDAPWEGNHSLDYHVFRDGPLYRMYYSTTYFAIEPVAPGTPGPPVRRRPSPTYCCYAESDDGIHWRKPALGLIAFRGSRANNIVLERQTVGAMRSEPAAQAVMKDGNPDAAPEARYKAFLMGVVPGKATRGLLAFQSPDGIHWRPWQEAPILTDGAFDSQNVVFWDAPHGCYRAYWRYYSNLKTGFPAPDNRGLRGIRTATSKDLRHWENQADLAYPGSMPQHLYTNQVQPYARAPQLYLGFPQRYVEPLQNGSLEEALAPAGPERIRQWPQSLRLLPDAGPRELRASLSERFGTALTEGVFMASRDGVTFRRWDEAFIRPGIERPGTWASGQNYLSSVVETASSLEGSPPELSLYASERYWMSTGSAVRRYTLRLDGFVALSAPLRGGEAVTRPLRFAGSRLVVNFSSSAAGSVQAEIQDSDGRALPGFAQADCPAIFGDAIEREIRWKHGDLHALAGRSVRLRFILRDANLYAFQFQP